MIVVWYSWAQFGPAQPQVLEQLDDSLTKGEPLKQGSMLSRFASICPLVHVLPSAIVKSRTRYPLWACSGSVMVTTASCESGVARRTT